jgi:hypothetical protein
MKSGQESSPLPERRIKENKTQGRTGAQFEDLIEEERRQELMDIRHMMLEEDSISVDETEEGMNLCFVYIIHREYLSRIG